MDDVDDEMPSMTNTKIKVRWLLRLKYTCGFFELCLFIFVKHVGNGKEAECDRCRTDMTQLLSKMRHNPSAQEEGRRVGESVWLDTSNLTFNLLSLSVISCARRVYFFILSSL